MKAKKAAGRDGLKTELHKEVILEQRSTRT